LDGGHLLDDDEWIHVAGPCIGVLRVAGDVDRDVCGLRLVELVAVLVTLIEPIQTRHLTDGATKLNVVGLGIDVERLSIAAHAEPVKLQWPREIGGQPAEPATLVLRVEGPVAIEIQHQSGVILERINRFFGWQAVGRIALRQAPLSRPKPRTIPPKLDAAEVARVEATLTAVTDDGLRAALGRLGAAVKRR
jgi:hypothetical protein